MTIRLDIEAKLKEKHVTKIDGQPTLEDVRSLDREIAAIVSEIETSGAQGRSIMPTTGPNIIRLHIIVT
jgi:hypothetical protein